MMKDEIKNLKEIASQNEDRENENLKGWLKSLWRIRISISSYQKMPADKKVFRYKYQIIDTVESINSDFIRWKNNNAFSIGVESELVKIRKERRKNDCLWKIAIGLSVFSIIFFAVSKT